MAVCREIIGMQKTRLYKVPFLLGSDELMGIISTFIEKCFQEYRQSNKEITNQ